MFKFPCDAYGAWGLPPYPSFVAIGAVGNPVASCTSARNTIIYCTGATGALRMTARASSVPQDRSKELFEPLRGAPGYSKELLKPRLVARGNRSSCAGL